ncbi:MAG: antibiotic biosynthesis monooxygenase family protein [Bacteroidota bacterium]|nr:antibiotic biosynthesis monooxygenase family protein [Bacteroidota bacterium]
MLVRIVKMQFKVDEIENFKNLFTQVYPFISNFPGCRQVTLVQQADDEAVFMTISHWDDDNALQNYRQSELFADTWRETKAMFQTQAIAWSVKPIHGALIVN